MTVFARAYNATERCTMTSNAECYINEYAESVKSSFKYIYKFVPDFIEIYREELFPIMYIFMRKILEQI